MGASNYHVTNSFRGSANTCIGEQKVEDNSPSQMFADPLNPSLRKMYPFRLALLIVSTSNFSF